MKNIFTILLAVSLTACGISEHNITKPVDVVAEHVDTPPAGELDNRAYPLRRTLELRIDPKADHFSGVVTIEIEITRKTALLWLHGKGLNVSAAQFITDDGESISVTYEETPTSGVAAVRLARPYIGKGALHFEYDAPLVVGLNGLYAMEEAGLRYVGSQMQDSSFRQVAPSFDQPRFKVPTKITLVVPEGNVAISNAPEVSKTKLEDGWVRHIYSETRPLPVELLAVTVGPYDVVEGKDIPPSALRDHAIPLRAITSKGKGAETAYALEVTGELLGILEEYFGVPYPYEKLDLVAPAMFLASGMENAGSIYYRQDVFLMRADSSKSQRDYLIMVHAHELAHMWFGDLVTPKWWTDLWLSESFATWMGEKTAAIWSSDPLYDRKVTVASFNVMKEDALISARAVRQPIVRTEEISRAFNGFTYSKGAAILTMFEHFVGADVFREGVRSYISRYADGNADFDDFSRSVFAVSGNEELAMAMATFVDQPGVPVIAAELDCTNDIPVVHVQQSPYRPLGTKTALKRLWDVPVCFSHVTDEKRGRTCALLKEEEAVIELPLSNCPSLLFPNAEGMGYYHFTMDGNGWQSLQTHFDLLTAGEALSFLDSLEAGFNAGIIDADDYLDGLATAGGSSQSDITTAALRSYTKLFKYVGSENVENLRRVMSKTFASQMDDAAGEEFERWLSRSRILDMHDVDYMKEQADFARLTLKARDFSAVTQLGTFRFQNGITAALMLGGDEFYEELITTKDQPGSHVLAEARLHGISGIWDTLLAERVRREILNTNQFESFQVWIILERFLNTHELRAGTWDWLQDNYEALIVKYPSSGNIQLAGTIDVWCDLDRAANARMFFEKFSTELPYMQMYLEQGQESVEICAALSASKSKELGVALSR